jgi:hypothetical protein
VSVVSEDEVQAAEAYLLFYERAHSPAAVARRDETLRALTASTSGAAGREGETVLLSRGWWARYLSCDEPGPVTHADVLCPHGCVDTKYGRTVELARQCLLPVPAPLYQSLVREFVQAAPPAPPVRSLTVCAVCEEEHAKEREDKAKERDTIKALDSTEISPGGLWYEPSP